MKVPARRRKQIAVARIPLPKGTIDEVGHSYGCLTVKEFAGRDDGGGSACLCHCECGDAQCKGAITVRGAKLRSGRVVSCGRLRANAGVRQAARMKVPARRRKQIAVLGGAARQNKAQITPFRGAT